VVAKAAARAVAVAALMAVMVSAAEEVACIYGLGLCRYESHTTG
jgi:hypothetical protein